MALDDLRNLVALDLFEPNDLLTLSSAKYQKGTRLAGVGWSRHWFRSGVTALATHHETLLKAMQAVQAANPDYVFYLLAGHTAAQPDTRTTRHRRLWKSLASSGLAISPNRQSSGECQPDREDGLRFFG
ncbi:MAG: hypothetical protein KDB68_17990, partial [Planctomycetes bacterium]|nr:hypothetical protein [Planctomycetota bacterium]